MSKSSHVVIDAEKKEIRCDICGETEPTDQYIGLEVKHAVVHMQNFIAAHNHEEDEPMGALTPPLPSMMPGETATAYKIRAQAHAQRMMAHAEILAQRQRAEASKPEVFTKHREKEKMDQTPPIFKKETSDAQPSSNRYKRQLKIGPRKRIVD